MVKDPKDFDICPSQFGDIKVYKLKNRSGAFVKISTYGGIITECHVPDSTGKLGDVVLGHQSLEEYLNAPERPYLGAIIGRYGNRIAKGRFTLDGKTYSLAVNNGPNHLHGGLIGYDKVVWSPESAITSEGAVLELRYYSRDGEEGYPGNVEITVTYLWTQNNTLRISYNAVPDAATPINLTNHSYFNLTGEGCGTILNHQLQIFADRYCPIDATSIPLGELSPVEGTPFDFRISKTIGRDIEAKDKQLERGAGYDHTFVLGDTISPTLRPCARVVDPASGRTLDVRTTEPGVQLYTGNFLSGVLKAKNGGVYERRGGFCLETQHFPDSPNQPRFPTTFVQAGQTYTSCTEYQFGVVN